MNFNAPYNRSDALAFLDHFLPDDFAAAAERVKLEFDHDHITEVFKIGHAPALDLPVYEIHHTSENDPRVSLSKGAFRLLAAHGQTRALVLFASAQSPNYRLSLVTIDLQLTGKKVVKEYSNPRRYSFFLGPDAKTHTPREYLEKKGQVKDFDDLQKRFSIEVVNKDFYNQIAALFTQLTGGVRGKGKKALDAGSGCLIYPGQDDQKRKEFAVRLIGRLVFCWFLKKKGSPAGPLIPESLLSIAALSQKDYYHTILEPLFFQVLNTPGEERDKHFQAAPWSAIPFLNGGLFSPQHDDYYEPGSLGLSKNIGLIKVPDAWLKELFNVFETYNFTIDENTSVDVELSIDPEMLGRIFENLLAEINPETGETARKATGSYYTPRPIVEYMVGESLKQYLLTKTSLPEEKIAPLLSYSENEPALKDTERELIIDALHRVKVIDPACGSGAFPMGILQKILLILQKLDPDSSLWREKMLARIPDPFYRKELRKNKIPNYVHKLGIIHDCIYGVDIQPIAVEISKLRCFLSLIVDEKVDDQKDNRGIVHLPNLEFKFVCANTLIGLPQTETQAGKMKGKKVVEVKGQTSFLEDTESIDELRRLREEYLNCTGKEKAKIEKCFRSVQTEMFKHALFWQGTDSQTEKLSQWDPFSHEPCHWFDPEWMFGIKEGFDIVIANPPYIVMPPETYSGFNLVRGNYNTYVAFIEVAQEYLTPKGVLAYIIPTTWMAGNNFRDLRKFLINNKSISQIIQLPYDMFHAYIDNVIIIVNGNLIHNDLVSTFRFDIQDTVINQIKYHQFTIAEWSVDDYVIFLNKSLIGIKKKYKQIKSKLLGNIAKVQRGTLPPKNNERISLNTIDKHRKLILWFNSQVYRYEIRGNNSFLVDYDKLRENKPIDLFRCKKLLGRQLISRQFRLSFAYYEQVCAFKKNLYAIYSLDEQFHYYYLLAILNSRFYSYIHVNMNTSGQRDDFPSFSLDDYRNFLIPDIDDNGQIPFISLVDQIIAITKSEDYSTNESKQAQVNELEAQIDQMVYKLYGLTAEEIALVEGKSS